MTPCLRFRISPHGDKQTPHFVENPHALDLYCDFVTLPAFVVIKKLGQPSFSSRVQTFGCRHFKPLRLLCSDNMFLIRHGLDRDEHPTKLSFPPTFACNSGAALYKSCVLGLHMRHRGFGFRTLFKEKGFKLFSHDVFEFNNFSKKKDKNTLSGECPNHHKLPRSNFESMFTTEKNS